MLISVHHDYNICVFIKHHFKSYEDPCVLGLTWRVSDKCQDLRLCVHPEAVKEVAAYTTKTTMLPSNLIFCTQIIRITFITLVYDSTGIYIHITKKPIKMMLDIVCSKYLQYSIFKTLMCVLCNSHDE